MPLLVTRKYEELAGQKGSTIDVPIPSSVPVVDVVPANLAPNPADQVPTHVGIVLDRWKEAPFQLTDKEMMEVMEGTIPMMAEAAIASLVNEVDTYLLSLYTSFYSFTGTPGITPFASSTVDATEVARLLNNEKAPMDPRWMVLNPNAQANALNLRAFQDISWSGSADVIANGEINRRLGFGWVMDQNVQTHTAGTGAGYLVNGTPAVGAKIVPVDTGTGTLVVGDIITFAGDLQTYVITVAFAGGAGNINIEPGLRIAPPDDTVITKKASHVVNLGFHRDAIALVSRPLADQADEGFPVFMRTAIDPLSGLVLRLEVTREYKRRRFSYDILYGAKVIRPELGVRLAG